ncbi:MAG: replicative DNA helicase [Sulfuricurvum sp.]|uniref:replicative DNA helicase n=1 Tax=Sulfuricurvum sp. TaxID=2025608 RepID=UPI002616557E|nr:replicative DNA helicase [Sulfuricurvum sp.]MDD2828576.1 replicative DNA helicase [Sulfuricurvum sp.]MDD4948253.1 replicative DNA helicase [Sulfuricurvum sp.]
MEESLYNLAFERSILSSIIFDPAQFDEFEAVLNAEDFYLAAHQEIFRAMLSLAHRDLPIDEEFIKKELSANQKFDERVLVEILTANPISNTTAYVQEIKDKAIKRHLLTLTTEIKRVTLEENLCGSDVVDLVEKKLYEITQNAQSIDFKDAPLIADATLAYIEEMKARGDSVLVGVDTGYAELNKMTTGYGKGDLVIVAARPAMGKTSFALNMVQNLLDKGKGVAFFSLEMPAEQLMLRLLSVQTSIQLQRLRVGDMNPQEYKQLNDAVDKMRRSKLFVDDHGSVNIHQLRSKLRKLKSRHPEIEVAVIDYLQIMNGTGGKDRHLEVSEISRGLKMLARELEIPIVALSQLNRGLESRADKRPMLSDIRESGSIEQDADIILFVYRNDVYLYKEEKEREKEAINSGKEFISKYVEKEEEEAEIIIGKQRNGPTGHVKLMFQKKFTRFVDRPTFGAAQIVYETVDMKSAVMNLDDENVGNISMPII